MKRTARPSSVLLTLTALAALAALPLSAAVPHGRAAKQGGKQPLSFEAAKFYIEYNSTDQDVGVQLFLDTDDAWKSLEMFTPDGRRILDVKAKGSLGQLGLSEFFFESDEPSLGDLPLDEFLTLFPEGVYTFIGKTVDGETVMGTATFTHDIPAGPIIVSPQEGGAVDPSHAVIDWNPVTSPAGIQIVGYEVVIEKDAVHVFDVKLPASVTSVTVSPEFLQPGTEYGFEVLAIEVGGNQTITEGSFVTQ